MDRQHDQFDQECAVEVSLPLEKQQDFQALAAEHAEIFGDASRIDDQPERRWSRAFIGGSVVACEVVHWDTHRAGRSHRRLREKRYVFPGLGAPRCFTHDLQDFIPHSIRASGIRSADDHFRHHGTFSSRYQFVLRL
eukprot:5623519-Prymnesium_polylepis.1